jgi:hypothetical protein
VDFHQYFSVSKFLLSHSTRITLPCGVAQGPLIPQVHINALGMATIIYKKFIKKSSQAPKASTRHEPCIHQRNASATSDAGLMSFPGHPRESHELNEFSPKEAEKNRQFSHDAKSDCDICKEEKKAMKHYRRRLMAGLFFPFLVQSLDVTIIASALPFIASDFRKSFKTSCTSFTYS